VLKEARTTVRSTRRAAPYDFVRLSLVAVEKAAQKEKRMRLFRRARDTKTSVIRREAVSATAEAAATHLAPPSRPSSPVAPVVEHPSQPQLSTTDTLPALGVAPSPPSYEALEDSDVFVCKRPESDEAAPAAPPRTREVTLFVHAWHQVEPGLLSWTFPSLRAALDAVQRMKNAIGWCVVSGTGWTDLEAARAGGAILVEQLS
jgi:hypothetical protein